MAVTRMDLQCKNRISKVAWNADRFSMSRLRSKSADSSSPINHPTLTDAFKALLLPELRENRTPADTISQYERAAIRFDKFAKMASKKPRKNGQKYGIAYTVLLSSNPAFLTQFQAYLSDQYNLNPRTINKYISNVVAVLNRCLTAPPDFKIESIPRYRMLTAVAPKKLYLRFLDNDQLAEKLVCDMDRLIEIQSSDDFSRIYMACESAVWPDRDRDGRPLDPVKSWRSAIVMYLLYGFRTEELIAYTSTAHSLTWSNICDDAESPAVESLMQNESGWLQYVPEKQSAKKPDPLILPLLPVARRHLVKLRPSDVDGGEPIFNWPRSPDSFYDAWKSIISDGGLQRKKDLKTGELLSIEIKHLRKTCATWHDYHTPGISPLILGHAARGSSKTTANHYINPETAIAEHFAKLPIPSAWETGDSKQGRLF